jgi:hypothetical protein
MILRSIIEQTHPYFLVSTLTIASVYSLLAGISSMLSTSLICSTLVVYVLFSFIMNSTFFYTCLVITLKRVSSRRHCLFCHRLPSNYNLNSHKTTSNSMHVLKCRIQSLLTIDSIYKTFIAATLCLFAIVCVLFSLWSMLSIDTRLFGDELLPRDARALRSHMQAQTDEFDMGPVVIFTIPESIDYNHVQTKTSINNLIDQCRNESRTNSFKLLWLDYENVTTITHGNESIEYRITPLSNNDLLVVDDEQQSSIVASRFYCQLKSIQGKIQ